MTSEEIRTHEFESLADGGYAKEEVDAYINELAKAYEDLFNENKEIVRRLTVFAKKLDEYKRNESYMTETLLTAQKTAAQTISGAESVVAKMIEAAKNEGRKIVSDAKERANETVADRDKIIADAEARAQEILEEANAQADAVVNDAKSGIQKTIDEINGNADTVIEDAKKAAEKIVADAKAEAEAQSADVAAAAEKAKADAEALRAEAFEMKKEAVLYHEETVKQANAEAGTIRNDAEAYRVNVTETADRYRDGVTEAADRYREETLAAADAEAGRIRGEAEAFSHAVTAKAKAAAAGILLKAQAEINRVNDDLYEKTEKLNNAIAAAVSRYQAVKTVADDVYGAFRAQLTSFEETLEAIPVEAALPETAPVSFDEAAFVTNSDALNDAVSAEDIDGVLQCFGIDSDTMTLATETLLKEEAARIAKEKEEKAAAEKTEEEQKTEETVDEVTEPADEPEVEEPSAEAEPRTEDVAADPVDAPVSEPAEVPAETPAAEEPDDFIADEFELILDEADAQTEETPERTVEEAAEAPQQSEPTDVDALFDEDWNDIGETEAEDDVKEFVPEVPAQRESMFTPEPQDAFGDDFELIGAEETLPEESVQEDPAEEDFEIDFSMFEVDENKSRERTAGLSEPESSRHKKKKKKKR